MNDRQNLSQNSHHNFLVAGLGNPGSNYSKTRHNAGFMFCDYLANLLKLSFVDKKRWQSEFVQDGQLILLKPQTFMNLSGQAVSALRSFYKLPLNNIFVAFDDLDIELGTAKVQFGRGPKAHNGLNSIYEQLGSQDFWHIRIGIDTRMGDRTIPPDRYVLQSLQDSELKILQQSFEEVQADLKARGLLLVPGRA